MIISSRLRQLTLSHSALHFDSPDGFGAWKIIVRNSVQNVLRRARKKRPAAFDIIVKKIKYISTGVSLEVVC